MAAVKPVPAEQQPFLQNDSQQIKVILPAFSIYEFLLRGNWRKTGGEGRGRGCWARGEWGGLESCLITLGNPNVNEHLLEM